MSAAKTSTAPGPGSTSELAGDATSGSATAPGGRWRRLRGPLIVFVLLIGAGVISALLVPTSTAGEYDPGSADPNGSRAVATILAEHGVPVRLVRRSTDAAAGATSATTLLVVHSTLLGPDQLDRLRDSPADLVLVEPDLITLDELAPGVTPAGPTPSRVTDPECTDPDAAAAGRATAGGRTYLVDARFGGCYPDPHNRRAFTVARSRSGARHVTVLGQGAILRNDSLAVEGNAALALRVLGARSQLRWYLPDPAELAASGGAPTVGELVPSWVPWVVAQVAIAAGIALLWRARRLGRLVTEPRPVVVRSAETQEGRARLYRQAGARGLAAATLRTATLRRLATRLGVPVQAEPRDVATLAAAAAGQDPVTVADVLLGTAPADDAALVRLASALDELERRATGRSPGGSKNLGRAAPVHRSTDREVGTR
jgi:hypothetical protein